MRFKAILGLWAHQSQIQALPGSLVAYRENLKKRIEDSSLYVDATTKGGIKVNYSVDGEPKTVELVKQFYEENDTLCIQAFDVSDGSDSFGELWSDVTVNLDGPAQGDRTVYMQRSSVDPLPGILMDSEIFGSVIDGAGRDGYDAVEVNLNAFLSMRDLAEFREMVIPNEYKDIAIAAGVNFAIVPAIEAKDIALMSDGLVSIGGHDYKLYRGQTFDESRKVDAILDQYEELSVAPHRVDCSPSTKKIIDSLRLATKSTASPEGVVSMERDVTLPHARSLKNKLTKSRNSCSTALIDKPKGGRYNQRNYDRRESRMDKLDRAGAAGLGLLDLDRVFDAAREMIMDPQQCEGYLKWPAVATLGAIMAEPNLLSAVAEVALDGIVPDTYAGQKSWLLARALFTASTAQAEYEIERGLELSPSDRTHINPKASIAVQDYISRDEKLAVMKFYVMADTELSRIAMSWPAGPYGQFRIGDEGYVTDEQFGRVIPDPADQSLYEYIANGGALTDDVVHAAVRGNTGHIDTLASQAIENDPEAPVFYTEATQDEWDESVDEGYVQKSDIKTERAHEMPGTKNLIAQISRKLGGGTEGALHTTASNRTAYFHYGQA